jgi:hypothetical protein
MERAVALSRVEKERGTDACFPTLRTLSIPSTSPSPDRRCNAYLLSRSQRVICWASSA